MALTENGGMSPADVAAVMGNGTIQVQNVNIIFSRPDLAVTR